jgi:hypothetical protein
MDSVQDVTAFVKLFYEKSHFIRCQIIGRVQTYELEKVWKLGVILIAFILSEIDGKG